MRLLTLEGFNKDSYMNNLYSKGLQGQVEIAPGVFIDTDNPSALPTVVNVGKPKSAIELEVEKAYNEAEAMKQQAGMFVDMGVPIDATMIDNANQMFGKALNEIVMKYLNFNSIESLMNSYRPILDAVFDTGRPAAQAVWNYIHDVLRNHFYSPIYSAIQTDATANQLYSELRGAELRAYLTNKIGWPDLPRFYPELGDPPKPSNGFFDQITDTFSKAINFIGDKAHAFLSLSWEDLIPDFVKDAINEIKSLPELIPAVMGIINNASQWLNPVALVQKIEPVLMDYLKIKVNTIVKEDVLNQVVAAINENILREISDKVQPIQNLISDFNHMAELPALIQDKVSQQLNNTMNQLTDNLNKFNDQAQKMFSAAGNLSVRIETLVKNQKSIMQNNQVSGLAGQISDAVNMVRDLSNQLAPEAVVNFFMQQVVTPVIDNFRPYFKSIMSELVSYVRPLIDQITDVLKQITSPLDFLKNIPRLSDFVSNIIDNFLFPKVNQAINEIFSTVFNQVQPLFDQLNNFFATIEAQISELEAGQQSLIDQVNYYKNLTDQKLQSVIDQAESYGAEYEKQYNEIMNSALSEAEKTVKINSLNATAQAEVLKMKVYSQNIQPQKPSQPEPRKTMTAEELFFREIAAAYDFNALENNLDRI